MKLEPRLDPDEIEFFKSFMAETMAADPETQMTEWGSGGSTLMFLPYFTTGKLVSIEHNPDWYDNVSKAVGESEFPEAVLNNFTYCYEPPMVDKRFYGYGVPFEENPCFAARYIDPGLKYIKVFESDIYFVDGICRGAVLATIQAKAMKRDAAIFIHDYYGHEERIPWYKWASNLYSRVVQVGSTLARVYL